MGAVHTQSVLALIHLRLGAHTSQVPCNPPGNIKIAVTQLRREGGGYIRLALRDVAGSGDVVGPG